jgi:thiol-disulfide isomerase/thioredoxin
MKIGELCTVAIKPLEANPLAVVRAITFLVVGLFFVNGWAQDINTTEQLIAKYNSTYSDFVGKFRAATDNDDRFALIRQASQDLNALLADHVDQPTIAEVLPKLVETRLVDLEPTFIRVIEEHPDRKSRALALLCFAKYSGNNERLKTCRAALGFLKQSFGKVPYQKTTFGQAAEEELYFYTHLAVGCPAPATVGEDADGAVFRLADYRGKVVMLRFWGDWCPACRRMYGYERELVGKYSNQPFALIGVNSDSREVCQRAQRESNLMWRSVWDGGTTNGPIATVYRVEHWPTIVVIDAEGVIQFRSHGLDQRKLDRVLQRLVADATHDAAVAIEESVQ